MKNESHFDWLISVVLINIYMDFYSTIWNINNNPIQSLPTFIHIHSFIYLFLWTKDWSNVFFIESIWLVSAFEFRGLFIGFIWLSLHVCFFSFPQHLLSIGCTVHTWLKGKKYWEISSFFLRLNCLVSNKSPDISDKTINFYPTVWDENKEKWNTLILFARYDWKIGLFNVQCIRKESYSCELMHKWMRKGRKYKKKKYFKVSKRISYPYWA